MLIGSVVDNKFCDDPDAASMCFFQEDLEIAESSILSVNIKVIGDVVSVVLHRRGIEREDPDCRDAEILNVIKLLGETRKVPNAISVAVEV